MISGFLHLMTSQPRYLNSRYQRIGIINHLGEWHWHWKRITLLAILLFGEAGGLYMSYLERSWSGAVVVYVVKTSGTKGEPLKRATWTLTGSGSSQICQPPFG